MILFSLSTNYKPLKHLASPYSTLCFLFLRYFSSLGWRTANEQHFKPVAPNRWQPWTVGLPLPAVEYQAWLRLLFWKSATATLVLRCYQKGEWHMKEEFRSFEPAWSIWVASEKPYATKRHLGQIPSSSSNNCNSQVFFTRVGSYPSPWRHAAQAFSWAFSARAPLLRNGISVTSFKT